VIARFPDASRITVRMLLDHRSRIPDYANTKEFDAHFLNALLAGELPALELMVAQAS
jgi:CubicO group peptidase (beta-lactamase class C family)